MWLADNFLNRQTFGVSQRIGAPRSLRFNSTTDRLTRTASLPATQNITMCGWAQRQSHSGAYASLAGFSAQSSSPSTSCELDWGSDGLLELNTYGDGSDQDNLPTNRGNGEWFFWAIQQSAAELRAYAGGANGALESVLSSLTKSFMNVAIWLGDNGWGEGANVRIAPWKVWSAFLTAKELEDERWFYSPCRLHDLNLWIPGDILPVAEAVKDLSGNARDGTATSLDSEEGPPIQWAPLRRRTRYFFIPAGAAGITATLTQTLAGLTRSIAGAVAIAAAVNKTLGALTSQSDVDVEVKGSTSKTLGALTVASAGKVDVLATLNKTLGGLTLDAEGVVTDGITAALNKTLDAMTGSAVGKVDVQATVNKTLDALGAAITVAVAINAQVSRQLGALTAQSAGDVEVKGALNKTLGGLAAAIAGAVGVVATVNKTLGSMTLEAAGVVGDPPITATLNQTLGALTGSAEGDVEAKGSVDKALGGLGISAAGKVDVNTQLNKALAGLQAAIVGDVEIHGSLSKTLAGLAAQIAGSSGGEAGEEVFQYAFFETADEFELAEAPEDLRLIEALDGYRFSEA